MKRLLLFLAVLLSAPPVFAQIIPPRQSITAVSSGITVCTTGNCAIWNVPTDAPSLTAQITGTMTSMTVTFEGTADGTTWYSLQATNLSSASSSTTATAVGQYAIVNPGIVAFRARCTTYASGGINVTLTRGSASAKSGIGGGGGGGFTGQVYEWTRGDGTPSQTMPRGTITTSSPWLFTQTWNAAATAFNALNVTVTDTASLPTGGPGGTASSIISASTGSGDVFKIIKDPESGGGNPEKYAIAMNTNATGVSNSWDWVLKSKGSLVGFVNNAQTSGKSFSVRNILLASAGVEGADVHALTVIGGDQYGGFQTASGRLIGFVASATDAQGDLDTAIGRNGAGVMEVNTGTLGAFGSIKANYNAAAVFVSLTAPTIASGGCTSPAITHSNGTAAFLLTIGTSCTGVKSVTLTMPAASHFWACDANNNTSNAQQASNTIASLASSTTAVVLTNYARTTGLTADFTASDTLLVKCSGE